MLEIDNINTYYGETQALFDVSLNVNDGEIVSLLGPNGAGKTTTIRSILGLTAPKTGEINFLGESITRKPTHLISKRGIGWVPDDRRIFPALTVARNLELGMKKTRFRQWTLKETFEIFTAIEYLMERDCENLSGGEMQMVAISRCLLGSPGLILFDEPTQGLAPKLVKDVLNTILKIKQEGVSILLVDQNAELALSVSDRVYILDSGAIVFEGGAKELLEDKEKRNTLLGI